MSEIIQSISGLGLFLFGMFYLEKSLRESAGKQFKEILKNSTDTIFKSIMTGGLVTALVQSSGIVSIMVLSFIGAGLISLASGIGVVFGANIGTTATAWLVAYFGFKVKIDAFAISFAGIGGLLILIFSNKKRVASIGHIFVGLGLLFLGLNEMKEGAEFIAKTFDMKEYLNYHLIVYIIIGFIITSLIQSSSASTAIILSALSSGIINFDVATAMAIGANLGSTTTAIIGAIGGIPDKKRLALAHFIFNLITALIVYIFLSDFIAVTAMVYDIKENPTLALAFFHTLFNIVGVIALAFFIPLFAKGLNYLFKTKEAEITLYISRVDTEVPEASLVALKNEITHLFNKVLEFGLLNLNINPKDVLVEHKTSSQVLRNNREFIEVDENMQKSIKRLQFKILAFANELNTKALTIEESKKLSSYIYAVKEISFANEYFKNIKDSIDSIASEDNKYYLNIYEKIRKRVSKLFKNFALIMQGEIDRTAKGEKISNQLKLDNENTLKSITLAVKEFSIDEEVAVDIISTNRKIYMACISLFDVLKVIENGVMTNQTETKEAKPLEDVLLSSN